MRGGWGPCACPSSPRDSVEFGRAKGSYGNEGQAQGPRIHSTLPLVPTYRSLRHIVCWYYSNRSPLSHDVYSILSLIRFISMHGCNSIHVGWWKNSRFFSEEGY